MIEKNGFTFRRWIEKFNPKYKKGFISKSTKVKYQVDMFLDPKRFNLWVPDKEQYFEIETDLDMTDDDNIQIMIKTFDELLNGQEI